MLITNTRCEELNQAAYEARKRVYKGRCTQTDRDIKDLHDILRETRYGSEMSKQDFDNVLKRVTE